MARSLVVVEPGSVPSTVTHANALDTEHVQLPPSSAYGANQSVRLQLSLSCFTTTMSQRSYTSSPALIDNNNLLSSLLLGPLASLWFYSTNSTFLVALTRSSGVPPGTIPRLSVVLSALVAFHLC
ncbi:hypothetical protein FB45DRAFT_1038303 [Roridomyces roridus]|uniref:Uncharacterized protein n=1 Tax=Roridomyces roridus TaxID=1738132 RepID=A0AAD7F922_9AGAR|nr:hypothetical protein FB45DRAFT_1038303 [Roridomyces roridus]